MRSNAEPRFVLTLWTDDPALALEADRAGVDRIGLDLERLGKRERQPDPRLWQTTHLESALPAVRDALERAQLFVRTNPPHPGWADEARRLIDAGAAVLMLPCFRTAKEIDAAVRLIDGRAVLVPLVETADALTAAADIARVGDLREVHIGLNDLALSLGLRNRFEVLIRPELEVAAHAFTSAGIRLGVGGVGRPAASGLPIRPDLIYAQYPRLGATAALLARSFLDGLAPGQCALADAVSAVRRQLLAWYREGADAIDHARRELAALVREVEV
jgi:2-keto-3-deoxy-L-rhamnonate aldolase RhmA